MCALALPADESQGEAPPAAVPWGAMRLSALLAAAADRHPRRVAFRDQPGRERWSGRPRLEWTYSRAASVIGRLAGFFAGLGLKPGSPIGICLPAGSEAALTLLAVEQAGHRPCLLPVAWREQDLERALAAAGVQAVVTQSFLGEALPADRFCSIAARSFSLRFLCAYGPDVPDGVIDLDRIILAEPEGGPGQTHQAEAEDDPGLITFGTRGGPAEPLHRAGASHVAAAVSFLVSAKIEPGDRILSLLAPDDLRGLATGSSPRSSAAPPSSATAFSTGLRS